MCVYVLIAPTSSEMRADPPSISRSKLIPAIVSPRASRERHRAPLPGRAPRALRARPCRARRRRGWGRPPTPPRRRGPPSRAPARPPGRSSPASRASLSSLRPLAPPPAGSPATKASFFGRSRPDRRAARPSPTLPGRPRGPRGALRPMAAAGLFSSWARPAAMVPSEISLPCCWETDSCSSARSTEVARMPRRTSGQILSISQNDGASSLSRPTSVTAWPVVGYGASRTIISSANMEPSLSVTTKTSSFADPAGPLGLALA